MNELIEFFTKPATTIIPQQQDRFYKYKIGDRVRINLNKAERTALNFKYSLNYGEESNVNLFIYIYIYIYDLIHIYYTC